ncbi:hypothetical protein [Hymenobacter terrenus]|uniref:hypothetical protein n=1 Tax=Hymenobacter terrenus TaxID=1629124 RepID=UPI0012E07523|nr:hypothetical protein [Hymenobacter terrenus]
MRETLKRISILLVSVSAAAWLRMFDQSLSMQYWANLVGKPIMLWVAGLVIMPVFEFFYSWPAHLFIAGVHSLICRLKCNDKPNLLQSVGLGAMLGATGFLLMATANRDWIMRTAEHNSKLFIIYTATGVCYGWAYFLFITNPKRNQNSRNAHFAKE